MADSADQINGQVAARIAVWLALDDLPEQQQRAFRLRYELEIPTQQIAESLLVSVGTVKDWLAEANEKLVPYRHMLRKIGHHEKSGIMGISATGLSSGDTIHWSGGDTVMTVTMGEKHVFPITVEDAIWRSESAVLPQIREFYAAVLEGLLPSQGSL